MSSQSAMYTSINNSWIQQFGSPIGRNSIYKLDLYMLNGTIDFSTQGANLPNLVTANGSYLFKYLDNITGINLNGCINITQTNNSIQGEDKSQFLFDNMVSLQNLYVQYCSNLTGTVDLSHCTDIRQVYSNGTDVTIILPTQPKLTNLEEYAPESLNLEDPTVLQPAGVNLFGSKNLDSLVITNIPNAKSYTMFDKIMKNYFGELLRGYWFAYDSTEHWTADYRDISTMANGHTVSSDAWMIPTLFNVHSKRIEIDTDCTHDIILIRSTFNAGYSFDNDTTVLETLNFVTGWMSDYYYIALRYASLDGTYIKVTDVTDENNPILLFEWRA